MATVRKPPSGGEPPAPSSGSGPESELGPRKLIRPSLSEIRRDQGLRPPSSRKMVPPEQTNAEAYYYLKQMQARTPVVIRLLDGEELRGWIEWYDKDVIKLNRDGAPNLVVPKHAIKYLFKQEEERQLRRRARLERRERPEGERETPPGK
jgi:RNA chaperone Hfq